MTKLLQILVAVNTLAVAVGCGSGNRSESTDGSGDPRADLAAIWAACKESYRKTKAMPPPSEIPNGLATKYNYESTAGISLYTHSTNVIAYESKAQNDERYVLFSDGRIEQLSDSQLSRVGVDLDPLTLKERTAKREEKEKQELDHLTKRAQEQFTHNEKQRESEAKRERENTDREVEQARAEMERKRREFEDQQKKQRQKENEEIEKTKQDMEKKRKGINEQSNKQPRKDINQNKNANGPVPESAKLSVSPKSVPEGKPDIRTALRTTVSLKSPYPQSYPGAPTDRVSVQYAVKELLKQSGVDFDYQKSQTNIGELASRWITPNISNKSCNTALFDILNPLELSYYLEGGSVVLKRK